MSISPWCHRIPRSAGENPSETVHIPYEIERYQRDQARIARVIARAKNSKNPNRYENFNILKPSDNPANPSKTEIFREEKREDSSEELNYENPSTPADRSASDFDVREADECKFASEREAEYKHDFEDTEQEIKVRPEEEEETIIEQSKTYYNPAPKRMGSGVKIDQAALAFLLKKTTWPATAKNNNRRNRVRQN